jgi:hypothetical protein
MSGFCDRHDLDRFWMRRFVKKQASQAEPDPPEPGGSIFKSAHNNPLRQKIIEIIGISLFWVSFAQNRKKNTILSQEMEL